MNIVLLGSTGFVGRNVAEELTKNGFSFFPVSRQNGYDLRKIEDNFKFLQESNTDIIINCAAHVGSLNYVSEFAADVVESNSRMILNLYEAVQKYNPQINIIQPIANCAYPANALVYKEEEFWNGPLHPSVLSYGSTRRMLLTVAESYHMQHKIRSINLITPNMYGPFDSTDPNKAHALNALISKFVKAIKTGQEQVEIWGTGIAVREWLYASDFGRIVVEVLKDLSNTEYDRPFNIAQENGLSVKELINLILQNIDYKGTVWYNSNMPDGAPRKVMSKAKFEKIFPQFQFTSFEEGIKTTAAYYQSVYPY
ncbi:MAG: NAD-dependent epimerase/dehydratase family protein [Flavisolibacter sp.]|nr:NAD-dependent epimerase/dehydratase family protein [Flavisolibacter sp.]